MIEPQHMLVEERGLESQIKRINVKSKSKAESRRSEVLGSGVDR